MIDFLMLKHFLEINTLHVKIFGMCEMQHAEKWKKSFCMLFRILKRNRVPLTTNPD